MVIATQRAHALQPSLAGLCLDLGRRKIVEGKMDIEKSLDELTRLLILGLQQATERNTLLFTPSQRVRFWEVSSEEIMAHVHERPHLVELLGHVVSEELEAALLDRAAQG